MARRNGILSVCVAAVVSFAGCAEGGTVTPRGGDAGIDGAMEAPDADFEDAEVSGEDAAVVGGDAGPGMADAGTDAGPPMECSGTETMSCRASCGSDGTRACVGGRFGMCVPPVESCNGVDDDCDGDRDEGFECMRGMTGTCTTSCGTSGTSVCTGACAWGTCAPPSETCNGRDDDCNGATDEGSLCAATEACLSGRCERVVWIFEAEAGSAGHGIGRAEADGWSANTGADAPGMLVYGPYTRDIPAGQFNAVFRLMVDNNSTDDVRVLTLDVNDFDGDRVLATRNVTRREFTGTFAYQDFAVRFTGPGASRRLEFRTYWTDGAYVRQDRVTVRRVGPPP